MSEEKLSQHRADEIDGMRQRSGEVKDARPLVAFLYEMMRDHLQVGIVETVAQNATLRAQERESFVFENGWLAKHAQDLADRLTQS